MTETDTGSATTELARLKKIVTAREAEQSEAEAKIREAAARVQELASKVADLGPDQLDAGGQPKHGNNRASRLVQELQAAEREAREVGPARVQKARMRVHEAEQRALLYLDEHRGELLLELEPEATRAVDRIESAIGEIEAAVQGWFAVQRQVGAVIGPRRTQEVPSGDELHQLLRAARRWSGTIPEPLPVPPRSLVIGGFNEDPDDEDLDVVEDYRRPV